MESWHTISECIHLYKSSAETSYLDGLDYNFKFFYFFRFQLIYREAHQWMVYNGRAYENAVVSTPFSIP